MPFARTVENGQSAVASAVRCGSDERPVFGVRREIGAREPRGKDEHLRSERDYRNSMRIELWAWRQKAFRRKAVDALNPRRKRPSLGSRGEHRARQRLGLSGSGGRGDPPFPLEGPTWSVRPELGDSVVLAQRRRAAGPPANVRRRPDQVTLSSRADSRSSTVAKAKLLGRLGETKPRERAVSLEVTPRTLTMPCAHAKRSRRPPRRHERRPTHGPKPCGRRAR